jgi:formylglycine-generating enzyme required for sulfatase activity
MGQGRLARWLAAIAIVIATPWLVARALAQPTPPSQMPEEEDPVAPDDAGPAVDPALAAPTAPSASAAPGGDRGSMIHIAGATLAMGSADPKTPANEHPRHVETVAPFWIDATEVTVGAYRGCVDAHACAEPAKSSSWCTWSRGDAHLPVSCVHWKDAEAFCRDLGKRLPREAEWELAAAGPKGARYPWRGRTAGCPFAATMINDTTGRSCTKGPSRVGTHPAGATPQGVQDLSGNLEEWTADWYVENLAQAGAPAAGASHVLRGGGWMSGPSSTRTTSRNWGSSIEAGPNVGFRCAKDD